MFTRICTRILFVGLTAATALTLFPSSLTAQTPSISVTPTTVTPGGTVTVSVANGPGNITDWVGLYAVGAPGEAFLDWQYLNGLKTVPAVGVTAATMTFSLPTTPGSYQLRFMPFSTFTVLATSGTITVQGSAPTITVSPATVTPGGSVTVTVANGPGNPADWVGLHLMGAPHGMSFAWKYLNGLTTVPSAGITAATLTFTMPMAPGAYQLRLFANNSLTLLASSAPTTVGVPPPTILVSPATVVVGGTVTVTVGNGPGNATDWIAMYPAGAPGPAYADWKYLNGLKTAPPAGATSATVTFTMPPGSGTYDLRLMANNGYTVLATGTVATASPITVAPATVLAGGTVTVTIVGGPGSPTDWVALYAAGAANAAYLDWKYLNGLKTVPPAGVTSATLTFSMPTAPGAYELRFLANNGFDVLGTGTTAVVADTAPPVISNVAASSITGSGATITWTTNEASDSQVNYGLTTAYGSSSAINASLVTAHTVSLSGLTSGTLYHFRVRSRDAAGNLATSADATFTTAADGTAPTVALTAPAANATVSGSVTVSATAADAVGVAGVQFRLDGAPLGAEDVTAPYSMSWNTTTAANGSHSLTAVARDAAGNQTTSVARSVTVANDTAPPVISAIAASSITASGATITWTTNEASDSQVDYGLTTAYGSSSALNTSDVTSHSMALSGMAANTLYHYRVRSRDAANNLATSGDATFTTLDSTGPTVALTAPAANATVSGVVTVSATASDSGGVAGVQFRLDGAPLGAEDVTAPYTIAWNTQGSTDLVFGVTKVAVGPMTINPGSGFTKRLGVSCQICTGDDLASEDKIQSAAGQTAATFTFTMGAHYLAQMAAFKATATPAYVQGGVATSDEASAITAAFGAAVTGGNLLVVAVAWEGNSAMSVTDTRGNVYSVATSAYDSVNGQSLAILYAANAASGATTVTASFGATPAIQRLAIHEYSGIATTSPLDVTATNVGDGTLTANAVTSGSATTTVMPPVSNGAHTLTAQARDAAGNTTMSAARTVTVNNAGDTTAPVLSGITASSITGSGATIGWTSNEASDSQVDYGLTTAYGSASPLNGGLVTAHSVILGALTPSTLYHYRVRSRDAAGNLALSTDSTFTTVTVDVTPPTISFTAPLANATVSGVVTVSATAADAVGVVGVQFQRDGVNIGLEDTVAPYTVAWNTTTVSQGSHTLTAVAFDAAGNQTTATRTVTVANAAVQVSLAWDANTESDLAGYRVYIGTSSGVYSTSVNVGNVTAYTVTGLSAGTTYYFVVTASDQGGAESGESNEVSTTP